MKQEWTHLSLGGLLPSLFLLIPFPTVRLKAPLSTPHQGLGCPVPGLFRSVALFYFLYHLFGLGFQMLLNNPWDMPLGFAVKTLEIKISVRTKLVRINGKDVVWELGPSLQQQLYQDKSVLIEDRASSRVSFIKTLKFTPCFLKVKFLFSPLPEYWGFSKLLYKMHAESLSKTIIGIRILRKNIQLITRSKELLIPIVIGIPGTEDKILYKEWYSQEQHKEPHIAKTIQLKYIFPKALYI